MLEDVVRMINELEAEPDINKKLSRIEGIKSVVDKAHYKIWHDSIDFNLRKKKSTQENKS